MIDYVISSVAETTLMDVFEYKKKEKDDKPEYEDFEHTVEAGSPENQEGQEIA